MREMMSMPREVLDRIAAWRRLSEAEQVACLRRQVVDEVVGNMRMEGQPVSAAWESQARKTTASGQVEAYWPTRIDAETRRRLQGKRAPA